MKRLLPGLWAALLLLSSTALAAPPERVVKRNRLLSQANPALTIELPRAAKYVGADRWDLYESATPSCTCSWKPIPARW